MTLAPLLAAPVAVQVHAIAAFVLLPLTILQFSRPKIGLSHRAIGWTWVALMTIVAVSSFLILDGNAPRVLGPFGPIHVLSVVTLVTLVVAIGHRRRGNIAGHRRSMIILATSFAIAGLFTALPARVIGRMLLG